MISKIYMLYTVLMSVASKTKAKKCTTVVLGLLVAGSVLPTWANTSPGIIEPAVQSAVVSTQGSQQGTQELSVLRKKLKERFSGVTKEITALVNGKTIVEKSFHGSAERTIDVRQGIGAKPDVFGQDFFVDIENDPHRAFINRLAAYGVLSSSEKFYPQNYFRTDDFFALLSKIYAKKFGKSLPLSSLTGWDSSSVVMTKEMLQQVLSFLNPEYMLVIQGNSYDKLTRSEGAYYLVRFFDLPALPLDTSSSVFQLPSYFVDTIGHPFGNAITVLANLGIVSVDSQKFYPDNYLRHYDFVVMFVRSLLKAQHLSLPTLSFSLSFADVPSSVSYYPYVAYAADRGVIDPLVISKQGQLYFEPNAFINKHDVYQMIGKAANVEFLYEKESARQERMTRGECAQVLVDAFELKPDSLFSGNNILTGEFGEETLLTKLKLLLSML